jgi:hypothetical protein
VRGCCLRGVEVGPACQGKRQHLKGCILTALAASVLAHILHIGKQTRLLANKQGPAGIRAQACASAVSLLSCCCRKH